MTVFAAIGVGLGLALIVVGLLTRVREKEADLARILDLPFDEQDSDAPEVTPEAAANFFEPGVALAGRALERLSLATRIGDELMRARIPLRPGEFGLIAIGAGLFGGLLSFILTGQMIVAVLLAGMVSYGSWLFVLARVQRRRKAFEAQLPEALSLIAASLEAGHTFMHSMQMMVEESVPPLSQEFERVMSEIRLGDPLLEGLDRMAQRLQVKDLLWVVQAIRIQQTVGGKLAELLMTLADFMRAREEIRREVRVLTAEGRMSANVLGLLPIVVFVVIKTLNPAYLEPMLSGTGLVALAASALSVLTGIFVIRRMAKIEI